MGKYAFSYHGGAMPETEEEQAAEMAKWGAWFEELGPMIVDGGAPFGASATVASDGSVSDGGGANPVTGYSIISADSLADATAAAKGCPILESGGSVEVSEVHEM